MEEAGRKERDLEKQLAELQRTDESEVERVRREIADENKRHEEALRATHAEELERLKREQAADLKKLNEDLGSGSNA